MNVKLLRNNEKYRPLCTKRAALRPHNMPCEYFLDFSFGFDLYIRKWQYLICLKLVLKIVAVFNIAEIALKFECLDFLLSDNHKFSNLLEWHFRYYFCKLMLSCIVNKQT